MPTEAILIAGPCHIDQLAGQDGLIGGSAAYAAMAAAIIVPCQLWARCGEDFPHQGLNILEKRRIDLAGCISEGPANHFSHEEGFDAQGPCLPEASPTDAELLAITMCIDLPIEEARRAWKDLGSLQGQEQRMRMNAPSHNCQNKDELAEWASNSDVLIITHQQAEAFCGISEPLALAEHIQAMGCKAVILCNGNYGGLILYKNMTCGYLSMPRAAKEPTGYLSTFAGVLGGAMCAHGKLDFRGLKRSCASASAVAGTSQQGIGPKKLLDLTREDYKQLYNKLRRTSKF